MAKIYCCVPIKFKNDDQIMYELETVKNYYLSYNPLAKDEVEFVSNYVEDGHSRDYSLPKDEFKSAALSELTEAVKRLDGCCRVVFHPDYEADDVCKIVSAICKSYQFETRCMYMGK